MAGTCSICGGQKSEHYKEDGSAKTRHVYTEQGGNLISHEQQAQQQAQLSRPTALQGALISMGANPVSLGRLVEVLLDQKIITRDQALYIAGFGPKPAGLTGYADPARLMGGQS